MATHLPRISIAILAAAGLAAAGCSSSASESASPEASASPASASPRPTPSGPCELAPDTKLTDLTFEELNAYQLNNGEVIPTLEEFLNFADESGVGVLPEIKTFPETEGGTIPEPTEGQLKQYTDLIKQRSGITEVLIGSFNEPTLKYFADNEPDWKRIWFRGVGGAVQDAFAPPTVDEMRSRAPSADALGVINILYVDGTFAANGQTYNVPQEFADANIPVYIWYNTASGGDSAEDGAPLGGVASPGWQSIASIEPKNVTWIATDFTKEYQQWAESAPASAQPIPQMVAHRGGGEAGVSENSIAAFTEAVANGAQVLETDVQWTKPTDQDPNGVPVLMHDQTINRTTACAN